MANGEAADVTRTRAYLQRMITYVAGVIRMERNPITPAAMNALLIELSSNPGFQELYLDDVPFEAPDIHALCAVLATNPACTALGIRHYWWGGCAVQRELVPVFVQELFQALRTNTNLTHLDLSGLSFHGRATTELCDALRTNTGLRSLVLEHADIQLEDAQLLAGMLHTNKTLEKLALPRNSVQGARQDFVDALSENNTLVELYADGFARDHAISAALAANKAYQYKRRQVYVPLLAFAMAMKRRRRVNQLNGTNLPVLPPEVAVDLVKEMMID
jgi:hypothetical protein